MFGFKKIMTEQVSKWHPDKIADQISDAFVTIAKLTDKKARVAIETMVKKVNPSTKDSQIEVVIAGETSVDDPYSIAQSAVEIVFKDLQIKDEPRITALVTKQSEEIAQAVGEDVGAGDQGMMYGMATANRETNYLPKGHYVANEVIKAIEDYVDKNGRDKLLDGDAKVNVIHNTETDMMEEVSISVCHNKDIKCLGELEETVKGIVLSNQNVLKHIDINNTKFRVNPGGLWTVGGALADTGLTGRKIVADAYGGYFRVGGGAFSGKDLTKVDRSAAYMARKVAKELAEKHNEDVYIQVGYSIGQELPSVLSLSIGGKKIELNTVRSKDNHSLFERFRVSNMLKEFRNLDLYKISKGSHFRDD